MGNRQGTVTKNRKTNDDSEDRKRSTGGENDDPSTSNATEPDKKKRRRRGDRKSKKEVKATTKNIDETPPTAATTSANDAIKAEVSASKVAEMKPAELIDEGQRHQDHLLPELITKTTLTADDDDNGTKQEGETDDDNGTKQEGGTDDNNGTKQEEAVDGDNGTKQEGGTDDDNGTKQDEAAVSTSEHVYACEDTGDRKQLQLTIYRSYSNVADGTRSSVTCVASGSGIGGIVVERAEPRLDDVKIYRRSRAGPETISVEQLPEVKSTACGDDDVIQKATQSRQPTDAEGAPTSAKSSSVGVGKGKKKKEKKRNTLGRKSSSPSAEVATSKSGTAPARWNFTSTARDYPELIGRRSVKMRWDSVSDTRSRSSTVDNSPVNAAGGGGTVGWCRVSKTDFPDTAAIVRRLRRFEEHFVASFVDRFSSLPVRVQLASVAVAVRHVPEVVLGSTIVVSLQQYLRMSATSLAAEIESRRDYVIIIPEELFSEAQAARSQVTDGADITTGCGPTLAREAATSAASLAADEISRMFEYQIALVGISDGPIKMLAEHAADCVIDYVIGRQNRPTSRLLDRNTILEGVLLGRPTHTRKTFISVVVGQRELKWNLQEIFTRPGLRRETLLFPDDDSSSPAVSTPSAVVPHTYQQQQTLHSQPERVVGRCGVRRPPWTCHTVTAATAAVTGGARRCDPLLYGYRGLAVLWDFARGGYTVDESSTGLNYFDEMVVSRYDDFHRLYCPYRRLVGADVMRQHLAVARASPDVSQTTTFADLVLSLHGPAYSRDEIQPIYRPLVSDTVQLLPVRRRPSNAPPAVRRQSSSGAGAARVSVESAPVEAERPQIVIEAGKPTQVLEISTITDDDQKRVASTSLVAPSADDEKHSLGGNSSAVPSPTPSSSRLMVILAESGGNVRRLITDIRQHVKSAKEAARLKRSASAAEAAGATSASDAKPQQMEQPVVIDSSVNNVEEKETFKPLADAENEVPVEDEVFKSECVTVTAIATAKPEVAQVPSENTDQSVNAELASHPDVTSVDCKTHPSAGSASADTSSSKWNPDFKLQFPASKQERLMQAIGTLRAVKLTSNVPPEVTAPALLLDGQDQQYDDVYQLLTNEILSVNGHVGMCRPRLLFLTGCHGIGKSTLALAVSRRLITPASLATSDHDVTNTKTEVSSKSSGRVYEAVLVVECRGCDGTRESLLARIFRAFGLPYRARHDNGDLDWFCRWVSYRCGRCSPHRLLVVLDNLDCPADHGEDSSTVVNQLLIGIQTLTLLITARRSFYDGPQARKKIHRQHEYRVADHGPSNDAVLSRVENVTVTRVQMVPNLSEDDVARIGALCHHVPLALKMAASLLTLDDQCHGNGLGDSMKMLDVGGLVTAMSTAVTNRSMPQIDEEIRTLSPDNEDEVEQLRAIAITTLATLNSLDEVHQAIVRCASMYASSFSCQTIIDQLRPKQRPLATSAIRNLFHLGLINAYDVTSVCKDRCVLPPIVRVIARHLVVDIDVTEQTYCTAQIHRLVGLTHSFHSGQADTVLQLLDSAADRDNLVDAVRRSAVLLTQTGSETVFMTIGASDNDNNILDEKDPWAALASIDGAALLNEFLPEDVYLGLYLSLERACRRGDSTASGTAMSGLRDPIIEDCGTRRLRRSDARQCRALCCCAYREAVRGRPGRAADYAAQAYELLPFSTSASPVSCSEAAVETDSPAERAFCAYCLALVYRDCSPTTVRFNEYGDTGHRLPVIGGPAAAVTLARRAIDGYRVTVTSFQTGSSVTVYSSAIVSQIYAAELLATTLADMGQTQSALNACRLSDDLQLNATGGSLFGSTHPLTVSGMELRRRLWSGLGLLERARRAALAAGESATRYYGAEHPVTAKAVSNVCDAVGRSGAVDEAVCLGIQALALHVKTLGDHVDTAQAYRKLSQLLLRRRLVDAAVMFAEAGIDVLRRIGVSTKDAEQEVSRVRGRLSRDLPKSTDDGDKTGTQAPVPAVTDILVVTPSESCRRIVTFQQQTLVSRGQLVVGV